jgi:hypothetical protein
MNIVSKTARKDIVEALRARYGKATKLEKGQILGEFTAVSGHHRKHAIRLLSSLMKVPVKTVRASGRVYDEAVKTALTILWEAADRICGKRLKAAIPNLIRALESTGICNWTRRFASWFWRPARPRLIGCSRRCAQGREPAAGGTRKSG